MSYTSKKVPKRDLLVERLESRTVCAVGVGATDLLTATQAVAIHHYTESYLGRPGYEGAKRFDTQSALASALTPQIDEYWKDFFEHSTADALQIASSKSAVLDVVGHDWLRQSNFSTTAVTPDGFLYTVDGDNNLVVVDFTDASQPTERLTISGVGYQMTLLVDGNRLVTLESVGNRLLRGSYHRDYGLQTQINTFDITDRARPKLISTAVVDGVRTAAELKAETLTLVLTDYPYVPEPALKRSELGSTFETSIEYRKRVGNELFDVILPDITIQAAGQAESTRSDVGTWHDLALSTGSIARTNTVMRLDVSGVARVVASETVIGYTSETAVIIDEGDVYLVNYNSILRVHAQADGELVADASVTLPGGVVASNSMHVANGVLSVVNIRDRDTIVTTIGNTEAGWGVLGQLTLPGTDPYSVAFNDSSVLLELRGDTESWLQIIDLSDSSMPKAEGRQASHGLSQLVAVGDNKFVVSTYDIERFELTLVAVDSTGNLVALDRWQSTDGNAGGQNGVILKFAEGWLSAQYRYPSSVSTTEGEFHPIRLFDLTSNGFAKLTNTVSYIPQYDTRFNGKLIVEERLNYPTVPAIGAGIVDLADFNFDGYVTAIDVLQIVNYLNGPPQPIRATVPRIHSLYDVNGDWYVTPLDVLHIVNIINARSLELPQLAPTLDDAAKREKMLVP